MALISEHTKLKNKSKPPPNNFSNGPNGEPNPEENEEHMVNDEKWF